MFVLEIYKQKINKVVSIHYIWFYFNVEEYTKVNERSGRDCNLSRFLKTRNNRYGKYLSNYVVILGCM